MLILSRRPGESLLIYPDYFSKYMTVEEFFSERQIVMNIHSVQGKQVKLAIDAPDNLTILRKELMYKSEYNRKFK
ncbi:hypothetical protein A9Q79_02060 [Methylophaga sp. 42_25_T18]|nr:hypothetical protein A9Q79_02060 [Methylophaga sp. 42_25_T18]OUR88787.1 hypothetical protein A9Q92_02255 [Methylophaga sp. 42_8_T64]